MKNNKLLRRVVTWFRDLRLGYKLALVYILSGFLPVGAVMGVTSVQMRQILRESESESMESFLYQACASMENKLAIYNNLKNYICYNQTISQVLSSEYGSVYERYNQLVTILDPMLASLKYFHNDVGKVTIYVGKDMVKHGDTLAPISEITDCDWYRAVTETGEARWFVSREEGLVFLASPMNMLLRYDLEGILYISVEYDSVFESFGQTLQSNYGIVILDDRNRPVYENAFFVEEYESYRLSGEELTNELGKSDSTYCIMTGSSQATGWKVYLYKPNSLIVSSVTPITRIALIAVLVLVTAATAAILILTSFVTKRIRRLKAGMEEVKEGNLQTEIVSDSQDEIGDLVSGFDLMLQRLNTLIEEVYKGQIKEKEYQMRALQAQINPHFLYNTLSLINWKAIEAGADDISRITLSLSTFYRTSLNKGKNVMSLEDELRNMRSYLDIQLMMHDDSFDVEFYVDENLLQYRTLNLLLQPLIENAIAHGIDLKTDGRGKLVITGKEEDGLIVLTVEDNGVGMTQEQADRILTEESKGYGVRNVNERIRLYYGEQYSLHIESEPGKGTKAQIRIPKEL